MQMRLSTGLTPVYKFLFPGMWTVCAAYSIIDYVREPMNTSLFPKLFGLVGFWIVGGTLFYIKFGPLKRVILKNKLLLVSNYLTEVALPLTSIQEVREPSFLNNSPRRVVITMKTDTRGFKKIQFAPPFFSTAEVVNELRMLIDDSCSESQSPHLGNDLIPPGPGE